MAIIGTIRKNGWILIVMMTLALGGFILMEIVENSQRNAAGGANTLGKVNGKEIKRSDFERYQSLIYSNPGNNTYQIRQQVWNYFVDQAIISELADKMGLGVSKDELLDLQFSEIPENLSRLIKERYRSQDGNVDMNYLQSVKQAIQSNQLTDPTYRATWAEQEKEIIKERLQEKIMESLQKALYTPTWQAEMLFREGSERLDYARVRIPYDKIPESEVGLTDDDYKSFLKQNPNLYEQTEEARILNYVVLDVFPTSADSTNALEAVKKLIADLRAAENDSLMIVANEGLYDEAYRTKDNLPLVVADSLMRLPIGSIIGPYIENSTWNAVKILDRKVVPDSVRVSQIQFPATQPGLNRADSLLAELQAGRVRFDTLARISQDPIGAARGGDIGFIGADSDKGENYVNTVFYKAEKGKFYRVISQQGVFIVTVTDRKFVKNETGVKAAYLSRAIEPSKSTQQIIKDKAVELIQKAKTLEDLSRIALEMGLNMQTSQPLRRNDFIVGALGANEGSRDMVRWAFEERTRKGSVSQEVFSFRDGQSGYYDSKYVVAALKEIVPKGKATVATLKGLPEAEQRIKNLKRAELITARSMQASGNLSALANLWEIKVDTIRGAMFSQSGGEPRVTGVAFGLKTGEVSAPIPGNSGVYAVQPLTAKTETTPPADLTMFRRQGTSTANTLLVRELMPSLRKKSDLIDNRSSIF